MRDVIDYIDRRTTYGPVDFVALEFKGNQFKGEILPEIMDPLNRDIVRVIDMIVVKKDADGKASAARRLT